MAVLSLAGISAVLLTYFFTYGSLERTALASHVPWLGNYLYAIIQAGIVIFLLGDFFQKEREKGNNGGVLGGPGEKTPKTVPFIKLQLATGGRKEKSGGEGS